MDEGRNELGAQAWVWYSILVLATKPHSQYPCLRAINSLI